MASYKASLTDEEIQAIIDETKALRFFQDTPSTQEELEKIPMIEISDIQRAAMKITNQKVRVENFHVLKHDIETNGINYFKLLFEIDDITDELLPYAGLLTNVLGSMNTEKYDYTELTDEINLHTGGISTDISLFNRVKKGDYKTYFIVTGKALEAQSQTLAELMQEMILKTDFTDTKRLKEIISQIKSRMSAYISGNGHSVASLRAMAYYDESAYVRDMINGVGFYEFIKKLDENFESAAPDTVHKLQQLCQKIFRKDNVLFDLTSKETGFNQMIPGIASFEKALFAPSGARERLNYKPEQKNEGLMTSGMVQFDAAAGNFAEKGFSYHGALQILKVIMNYDYLWQNIRVKGGAYGCMSNFTSAGNAYFVTYRDPHLKESFNVFKEAAEYIRHFDCSPRDMTKYIIGAISNIDAPLTPAAEGARSLALYLTESTYEEVQKRRDELLDATVETIRSFGDLIDAFVSQNHICVVGSESEIKANETMFNSIRNI